MIWLVIGGGLMVAGAVVLLACLRVGAKKEQLALSQGPLIQGRWYVKNYRRVIKATSSRCYTWNDGRANRQGMMLENDIASTPWNSRAQARAHLRKFRKQKMVRLPERRKRVRGGVR